VDVNANRLPVMSVPNLTTSIAGSNVLMPSIALYLHELVLERMAMIDGRHIWLTNTVKIDFVASRPERQPLTRADPKKRFAEFVSHTMPPAAKVCLMGPSDT
jgi:hypothetical protein